MQVQSVPSVAAFASVAELRATTAVQWFGTVRTLGVIAAGDFNSSAWWWSSGSTVDDDGVFVVRPTAISAVSPGRWLRDWDGVHVRASWWGVIADANVKRTTDNTWWTSTAYSTPATDNTTTLRACFDAVQMLGTRTRWDADAGGTVTYGFRIGHPVVLLPLGGIYVADATNLLDDSRITRPPGVHYGFRIVGGGRGGTFLHVRQVSPAAGDWVFNDNNLGLAWSLEDLTIEGVTGAEQIIHNAGSSGYGQSFGLHRVDITGFKIFRTSGVVQADKTDITNCNFLAKGAGGYVLFLDGNSQSVGHVWRGVHATADGAGCSVVKATYGEFKWFGGTIQGNNGAVMIDVQSAVVGGDLEVNTVTLYGVRPEIHDSSMLFKVGGANVKFRDMDFNAFPGNTGNDKGDLLWTGEVLFDDCRIDDALKVALITNPAHPGGLLNNWRATLKVSGDGFMNQSWHDGISYWEDAGKTVAFNGDGSGYLGGRGRVIVANSVRTRVGATNEGGVPTNRPPAGSPYAWLGSSYSGQQPCLAMIRSWGTVSDGLPPPGAPCDLILPANCRVRSVRICKGAAYGGGGSTTDWQVADLDGTVYASMASAVGVPMVVAEEVNAVVSTLNQRTLRLTGLNGSTYAEGWVEVEYV
jgi:hypothetical protein